MKKFSIFAILTVILFTGCGELPTWDFFNTDISIVIRDEGGNNVLDLSKNIKIVYDGKTYVMENPEQPTRAEIVKPEWKGLRWNGSLGDNAMLLFGEFSADTKNYRGETFTINWGDGTSDEITFDLYVTVEGKGRKAKAVVHQATWVNGEPNSGSSLAVKITR